LRLNDFSKNEDNKNNEFKRGEEQAKEAIESLKDDAFISKENLQQDVKRLEGIGKEIQNEINQVADEIVSLQEKVDKIDLDQYRHEEEYIETTKFFNLYSLNEKRRQHANKLLRYALMNALARQRVQEIAIGLKELEYESSFAEERYELVKKLFQTQRQWRDQSMEQFQGFMEQILDKNQKFHSKTIREIKKIAEQQERHLKEIAEGISDVEDDTDPFEGEKNISVDDDFKDKLDDLDQEQEQDDDGSKETKTNNDELETQQGLDDEDIDDEEDEEEEKSIDEIERIIDSEVEEQKQ